MMKGCEEMGPVRGKEGCLSSPAPMFTEGLSASGLSHIKSRLVLITITGNQQLPHWRDPKA